MPHRKVFFLLFLMFFFLNASSFCQEENFELVLDISSKTRPKPQVLKANIDLSGRGSHSDISWPKNLAAREAVESWKKDIGFANTFRLQYNLWEISQLAKNKEQQDKLLSNYEEIIKNISEAGGQVILDIYGAPAGMGKVLDKRSAAINIPAFKALLKETMQRLSCEKKYKVLYELWSGTDLPDFYIGSRQEYFNMYKALAESARELKAQYKVEIPVGAPASSNWFHNLEDNTILYPEKSLIYEFIKFSAASGLPIDFISWHSYTSDPKADSETTIYNKNIAALIRDWLSYFNFSKNTPLIISEWNFDQNVNILPARRNRSFVAASFIPARIKSMSESGIDNQVYFALEDFQNNPENVSRNLGAFYFDSESAHYKGGPKTIFNVFLMLNMLGGEVFSVKLNDEFAGAIASKTSEGAAILIYNYIDPDISRNYISRNISTLNPSDRQFMVNIIRTGQFKKIISGEQDVSSFRSRPKVLALLNKAQDLYSKSVGFKINSRTLKINLKGISGDYSYTRYMIDSSCGLTNDFKPVEEKAISATQEGYQEDLKITPYSVNLVILKKKPVANGQ